MDDRNAIQRWIGVRGVSLRALEAPKGKLHRSAGVWVLLWMGLFAGPVAAQSATTVTIAGANRPSFSRVGQPVTFNVQLFTGNTEISSLEFTSGSPTGMSSVSCPNMPADVATTRICTVTYTTTDSDVAFGRVSVLGRWRALRPTGASRSGTTNTFQLPFTTARAPDTLAQPAATAGDAKATVAFAPPFDGGYPVDNYTVTSSPGGFTASSSGSPVTVTGLTNGTAYTFTVTATNNVGINTPSPASNSVTPQAAQTITFANPGAQNFGTTPTLAATASSALLVTFTSSTTGVCTISSGGTLTFLTTGTCTINADQGGDAATAAAPQVSRSFTVNAVVPGAPTIGTANAGDSQASVTFTAPASSGGAAITSYTVTANPGGFTGTGAGAPIDVTGLTNGVAYTFTVTATNAAGTGAASAASNSVTPSAAPTVTAVGVPGTALYGTGQNLDFTVYFDQAVTVAGTPRIALTIGATTAYAQYLSGSGTSALVFRHTVVAGESDFDGISVGALSLNGGSLDNANGTDAVLTLNSVGSTAGVLVGNLNQAPVNTVPGAQSLTQDQVLTFNGGNGNRISISDADAGGNSLQVTIAADHGVLTLAGTSGLVFFVGSGSGDAAMTFTGSLVDINNALSSLMFTPAAGYFGPASLQITSNDQGATGMGGAKTDTDTVGITVVSLDTTAPAVNAIDPADASPTRATTLRFAVEFSEAVTGVDASDFTLAVNGTASATIATVTSTDAAHYTVTVDNVAGSGTLKLNLNGSGTGIVDAAGNAASGFTSSQVYVIDNSSPQVTGVTMPANGQYVSGQVLRFTVVFDEVVTVSGTPNLPFTLDVGGLRQAAYVSGSGTQALTFAYTVVSGDQDLDGFAMGAAFALNGGTLADELGTAANTTLHGVDPTSGVIVGQLPQAITAFVANPTAPAYAPNGTFTVSATPGASTSPVVFATTTGTVCSVSGNIVTMLSAGTCSLTADQAADANHAASPQATLDVAIGAASQAITGFAANPTAPVYARGGTFALSATGGASGIAVVFASTSPSVCSVGGSTVTMLAAGTCALTANQAGNGSYTAAAQVALQVEIGRALPTLQWVGDMTHVVGEAAFELPVPTSDSNGTFSFTSSDPAVATVSGRVVTILGAGVTTLVATQAAAGNYTQATVSATLTVTDRPDPTREASVVGGLQAQVDAAVRFAAAQQTNIHDRLRQQRIGGAGNHSSNNLTFSMASVSGAGFALNASQFASFDAARLPQGMGVWTAGTVSNGGRDRDARGGEFDFRSDGVTVGADWRFDDRFVFGVAGGWGWNDTDLDDSRSELDARQQALSLYGMWRPAESWFVDGIVGWGSLDFDLRRYSAGVDATATAQRDGDQVFGAFTGGYEYRSGNVATVTGYGRVDASRTQLDAYREQGLGIYDLRYGSQTVDNSGASLGVEGSYALMTDRGMAWHPYWMLEYRDTLDNRSDVDLNYVVMPVADGYLLGMRSYGDNALTYGGGVDLGIARGWKLSLVARRQHGDGERPSNSFGLMLTYSPGAGSASFVSQDGDAIVPESETAPTPQAAP